MKKRKLELRDFEQGTVTMYERAALHVTKDLLRKYNCFGRVRG